MNSLRTAVGIAADSAAADNGTGASAKETTGTPIGSGYNVLVDAYNLQLPHGTGIKTYGMTLIKALRRLNFDVSLLYSRQAGQSNSPLLNELIFRDALMSGASPKSNRLTMARRLGNATLGLAQPVSKVPWTGQIRLQRAPYEVGLTQYTMSQCFEDAMKIHYLSRREMTLKVPDRVDVYHATYPLPLKIAKAKRVTTIHDIIPIILPNLTLDRKDEVFLRHQTVIRESDLIVTVSQASRQDILSVFDVPEEKVAVTYQPVDITDVTPEEEPLAEELLHTLKLEKEKYFLFVGAIEPKKNVRSLVDAYAMLKTDHKLVIVGKKAWLWEGQVGHIESVFGRRWAERIKLLDYLPYNHVRYLMKKAGCFVFPSVYEGFGLPVLEAMSLGTPVITSNTSSLPEVGGNAAIYVEPFDVAELARQMDRVMGSEDLRRTMSAYGLQQARRFSTDAYLERLGQAYAKVL